MASREEKINEAVSQVFKKFDTDHSGYLEENELALVLKDLFQKLNLQREVEKSDIAKMLKALDTDEDGKINP